MRTLLITIFSPFAARNILRLGFLTPLLESKVSRLVLIVPDHKKNFYEQELVNYKNVIVESVPMPWKNPNGRIDSLFFSLSLNYVETDTVKIMRDTWRQGWSKSYFWVTWFVLKLLSSFRFLRYFCRFFDGWLVVDHRVKPYFDKYKPDLVIATHAIYAVEQSFIREAKRRKIKTLSIVNSWDNLTVYKGTLRLLPDFLAVPNEIVKKEAINLSDFKPEQIRIIGMWNCDHYFKAKPTPRDVFSSKYGLDPNKPYILFASIGKNFTDTEWQDISIIKQAIRSGELPADLQILIRSHPDPTSPFIWGNLVKDESMGLQTTSTAVPGPAGIKFAYEITGQDEQNAFDAIYHSKLVVTIQSTISIEASLLDKPVININFDGLERRPFYHPLGVKRYHLFTHYLPIHKSGAVRLTENPKNLVRAIKDYLSDPNLDCQSRKNLANDFCWRLDGGASDRLVQLILDLI